MLNLSTLSFARPLWLLGLLPVAVLLLIVYQRGWKGSAWEQLLPKPLQPWLLVKQTSGNHLLRFITLGLAWILALLALAGPVTSSPAPERLQNTTVIVVLDVSRHMLADDLAPDRLTRAKQKVRNLMQLHSGSQLGLIAYAGSAHRVMPPSRDRNTLTNLLAALEPEIMPVDGQNLEQALHLASDMISSLPRDSTQVLLMTSGLNAAQQQVLAQYARQLGPQLSVLGVGTAAGAPVPLAAGGFLRDDQGRILLPRLNSQQLAAITRQHAGRYHSITLGDRDLNYLLQPVRQTSSASNSERTQLIDQGHWLLLLLLPLAALGARRGWLGLLLCTALLPEPAMALEWADLWQRPDQQGQQLLQEQQPAAAAERFEDPLWRAWALYQSGQYFEAAEIWEALAELHPEQAEFHFNRGTAFAMAGDYPQALEAYEQTLTRLPEHHAARHNRDLIESLLASLQQQAATATPAENGTETSNPAEQHGNAAGTHQPASANQTASHGDAETAHSSPAATPTSDAAAPVGNTASGAASLTDTAIDPPSANGNVNTLSVPSGQQSDIEHQQALEQWLRSIPDNPAELLRRKFLYQHLQQKEAPR